jgi:hypothetical protein
MGKARGISGGGIEGRQVTETRNPKREPLVHPVSMGAVSRLGAMVGDGTPHKNIYSSKATTPFGTTPSVAGPGGGRMVMPSGSQSRTPALRSMGTGRSLFK